MNTPLSTKQLLISAPSRIHFGLFSIGPACEREFGGVGLMLEHPRTQITVTDSEHFNVIANTTELTRRIAGVARQWTDCFGASFESGPLPKCTIEIVGAPRAHVGLGSGTQLAMAVMAGLSQFHRTPTPLVDEMIRATQRAKRSAIGSNGFFQGGLLVDRGRANDNEFAPLDFRDDFPDWPVVLAIADSQSRVFGNREVSAFQQLPPTPPADREAMIQIVKDQMLPALMQTDYDSFAESVFELGQGSGRMFESIQGGIYNGPQVTQIVDAIRGFGVPAVGQSSWGPCVFAITRDIDKADRLSQFLRSRYPDCEVIKTEADNRGVQLAPHNINQKIDRN